MFPASPWQQWLHLLSTSRRWWLPRKPGRPYWCCRALLLSKPGHRNNDHRGTETQNNKYHEVPLSKVQFHQNNTKDSWPASCEAFFVSSTFNVFSIVVIAPSHRQPSFWLWIMRMFLFYLRVNLNCDFSVLGNNIKWKYSFLTKYSRKTRSIPWLLMPWLLGSPSHQQPWHWIFRTNGSWTSTKKDFNKLNHLKCWEMLILPTINSAQKGENQFALLTHLAWRTEQE